MLPECLKQNKWTKETNKQERKKWTLKVIRHLSVVGEAMSRGKAGHEATEPAVKASLAFCCVRCHACKQTKCQNYNNNKKRHEVTEPAVKATYCLLPWPFAVRCHANKQSEQIKSFDKKLRPQGWLKKQCASLVFCCTTTNNQKYKQTKN